MAGPEVPRRPLNPPKWNLDERYLQSTAISAFMLTVLDDPDAATARATLGANNAANLTTGTLPDARVSATLAADKAFRRGNVLDTVSQSGGTPTGALIERGSNANGEYVKFADGTMICTNNSLTIPEITLASGAIYRSSSEGSWTFPVAFAATPSISIIADSPNLWTGANCSTTTATFRGFFYASLAGARTGRGLAVGRWF